MKQVLLVVVIHLLILHQYRKDRNEVLAPKKDIVEKNSAGYSHQQYPMRGIERNTTDSLRISYLHGQQFPVIYSNFQNR